MPSRTRHERRLDLVGPEGLRALGHEGRDHGAPAGLRPQNALWPVAHVLVAPLAQRRERDVQLEAFRGEPVFEALRALAVADPLQDPLLDEAPEPVGEHVPRDAEALLKLVEAALPEEDVADDQQRPALAHHLERTRDRAVLAVVVAPEHGETI